MLCPRRAEGGPVFNLPVEDHWTDDNCCSYCGSFNPDTLMERIEAGTVLLSGTDKNYKLYIQAAPGTDPVSRVGKFYFQHLSEEQMRQFVDLFNQKKLKYTEHGQLYVSPFFMAPVKKADLN